MATAQSVNAGAAVIAVQANPVSFGQSFTFQAMPATVGVEVRPSSTTFQPTTASGALGPAVQMSIGVPVVSLEIGTWLESNASPQVTEVRLPSPTITNVRGPAPVWVRVGPDWVRGVPWYFDGTNWVPARMWYFDAGVWK